MHITLTFILLIAVSVAFAEHSDDELLIVIQKEILYTKAIQATLAKHPDLLENDLETRDSGITMVRCVTQKWIGDDPAYKMLPEEFCYASIEVTLKPSIVKKKVQGVARCYETMNYDRYVFQYFDTGYSRIRPKSSGFTKAEISCERGK